MKQNIIYVGINVDDSQYPSSALDKYTGEIINFECYRVAVGPTPTVRHSRYKLPQRGRNLTMCPSLATMACSPPISGCLDMSPAPKTRD